MFGNVPDLRSWASDALREDPDLTLGISRSEATISDRCHFKISHFGSSGPGALVQGVDITHVNVSKGRRMHPQRTGT